MEIQSNFPQVHKNFNEHISLRTCNLAAQIHFEISDIPVTQEHKVSFGLPNFH